MIEVKADRKAGEITLTMDADAKSALVEALQIVRAIYWDFYAESPELAELFRLLVTQGGGCWRTETITESVKIDLSKCKRGQ